LRRCGAPKEEASEKIYDAPGVDDCTVVAAFVANPCAAQTDAWPSKPVRVIVPFAAGGSGYLARIVSDHLGRVLGQSFVIDNRAGAGGLVGEQAGARRTGWLPSSYRGLRQRDRSAMSPTPTFDPLKDFTHIAYLGGPPLVLLVHPSLGVKTFAEFRVDQKPARRGSSHQAPARTATCLRIWREGAHQARARAL
jgi:tripartite-type tricarboxylate transporter receptor subunit TctC